MAKQFQIAKAFVTVLALCHGSLKVATATTVRHGPRTRRAQGAKVWNRVSSFLVCSQLDATCDDDEETSAQAIAASDDGNTLIYVDGEIERIGFVDMTDPSNPEGLGFTDPEDVGGKPNSVGVVGKYAVADMDTSNSTHSSGTLAVIDVSSKEIIHSIGLEHEPKVLSVSPDKRYIAIAAEYWQEEDLGDGEDPIEIYEVFLLIMDTSDSDPMQWSTTKLNLSGLAECSNPDELDPTSIDINEQNECVLTFQDNNCIAIVDLASVKVQASFSAGTADLSKVDATEDSVISQVESMKDIPREPDGVVWIESDAFATADEGSEEGGSRGFTVFDKSGAVTFSSGNQLEHLAASMGHYPEDRSDKEGNEPEKVGFGMFGSDRFLFVSSEKSSLVFVYDVNDPEDPKFVQALPAGASPENIVAIPERDLLVVASVEDSRDDKMRSVINIYNYGQGEAQYPTLKSVDRSGGIPIPFGALSGLSAASEDEGILYAVVDDTYKESRILKINVKDYSPAVIVDEIPVLDSDGILSAVETSGDDEDPNTFDDVDLAYIINDDDTVNLDIEGIARIDDGFWLANEGWGSVGDEDNPVESLNFLLKVANDGVIKEVVRLPKNVNDLQYRMGFEGVAVDGNKLVVAFQSSWGNFSDPWIGIYDTEKKDWNFAFYPLDNAESQNGGWVGLSEISSLGDNQFLILERDNQAGPDAAIKRLYKIDLSSFNPVDVSDSAEKAFNSLEKTLCCDLIPDLEKPRGLVPQQTEGVAVSSSGTVWLVNDNDGVDDNSGETQLLKVCEENQCGL